MSVSTEEGNGRVIGRPYSDSHFGRCMKGGTRGEQKYEPGREMHPSRLGRIHEFAPHLANGDPRAMHVSSLT